MNFKSLMLIMLLPIFFTGCATTSQIGKEFNTDYVSLIKTNVTTESEIIKNLGDPHSTVISSNGTKTLIYHFTKSEVKYLDFGNVKVISQRLQVNISKDRIVSNFIFVN